MNSLFRIVCLVIAIRARSPMERNTTRVRSREARFIRADTRHEELAAYNCSPKCPVISQGPLKGPAERRAGHLFFVAAGFPETC